MRAKDFEIPVSWGHIAGVQWGEETGFPVVCVHGIQDNAGTFERLIPLLPKRFFWIAIDLPGHGKSSPFEGGHPVEYTHLVYTVKVVVDYFKLTKIYVMGHSMGAQLLCFFSSLYPEIVVKAVFLDGLLPLTTSEDEYLKGLRKKFDDHHLLETALLNKTPPSYSYDDAVNRLIKNRPNLILPEAAQVLIKRSLAISGDGFRYSTDQRFKNLPLPLINFSVAANIVKSLKCPCLLVIAEESLKKAEEGKRIVYYSRELLDGLQKFPIFTVKFIPGHHDVHLNDPESVAAQIIPFLNDTQSSL